MSKIAEERLYEIMAQQGVDSFLITHPTNVKYISSYTGADSFLFITQRTKYFFTDARYTEQASIECPDYTIVDYRTRYNRSLAAAVLDFAAKEDVVRIGFEQNVMTVAEYLQFQKLAKQELVPLTGVVEEIRAHKTPQEIEYLKASCDIACRAYERILKDIRVGITEKELAANLSRYMVLEGADTKPYGNILISGAKTSMLHGIPTEKAIEYGDLVLMDYGCQYHGYMSDMTRTVVVGKATEKQREVYQLVREMEAAQEASIRAGVNGSVPALTSARMVEGTEYQQYFYPNIGHGIGLFVHEIPFTAPNSTDVLYENSVTTVEPGIYIPGWGGIRIENQVLVTKEGCESMVWATRELLEL